MKIELLEQIRNKMINLIKGINDIDLKIHEIDRKDELFNISRHDYSNYIHIRTPKFEIKGSNLEFKTSITYNKKGERGRIKGSPGSISSLLGKIKDVYPPISKVIENEEFLHKEKWNGIFIPLGTTKNIDEAARRLLLFAGLKIFYTPGKKPTFADDKFNKLYAKIGTRDTKQSISNEDNKENKLFYITNAIRTKPFIILSGISGTGKTQIARLIPIIMEMGVEGTYGNSAASGHEENEIEQPEQNTKEIALVKLAWCGTGYWEKLKLEEIEELGSSIWFGWQSHGDGFPHEAWNFNKALIENGRIRGHVEHIPKFKSAKHFFLISQKNNDDWLIVGFLGNVVQKMEKMNWKDFVKMVQPELDIKEFAKRLKSYTEKLRRKGKKIVAVGAIPKTADFHYLADAGLSVRFFPEEGFINVSEQEVKIKKQKGKKIKNVGNTVGRGGVYISLESAREILEKALEKHRILLEKYKGTNEQKEIEQIIEKIQKIKEKLIFIS